MTPRPLEGLLVADFTAMVAGPWCTRLLADCGARVVKVEAEGDGDIMRYSAPVVDGMSRVYAHYNCGKESISLDLKTPDGIEAARKLIGKADIVVENYRPGVMKRFGLDYETVKAANPLLIYCSISGFGQTGDLSRKAAYAPLVHAYSGLDFVFSAAQGGDGAPLNCGVMLADVVAASYAFGAIQTALVHRERNGLGSHVDVSLMESAMSLVAQQYQEAQSAKPIRSMVFEPIRARDGHIMIALVSVKTFLGVYPVIGRPEWASDPAFNCLAGVMQNRRPVMAEIAVWAADRPVAECERLMSEAGVPCTAYCKPVEQLTNPLLRERGSFQELRDADGTFTVLNPPFRLSGTDCTARPFVARPDAHKRSTFRSNRS
jgi:crotonobetainyl-CoA:carnitine CoA-transferase CaiB-like acyl-CoA transferase